MVAACRIFTRWNARGAKKCGILFLGIFLGTIWPDRVFLTCEGGVRSWLSVLKIRPISPRYGSREVEHGHIRPEYQSFGSCLARQSFPIVYAETPFTGAVPPLKVRPLNRLATLAMLETSRAHDSRASLHLTTGPQKL